MLERNITTRDLARRTAALLEEVEFDEISYLVIRHGRAVARISPVEGAPPLARYAPVAEQEREPEPDFIFDEDERAVLLKAGQSRGFYRRDMSKERALEHERAARRLEDRNIFVLGWMGYELTRTGARALKALTA